MRDNKLSSNSSSASLDWKRRHGRATFETFCAAAELPLVRGTIEPPEPPAVERCERAIQETWHLLHQTEAGQMVRIVQAQQLAGDSAAAL
jgi:hypothetical protein